MVKKQEEQFLNKDDIILYLILNTFFVDMTYSYPKDSFKKNFERTLNELNKNLQGLKPAPSRENYERMTDIISILRTIEAFSLVKDDVFDYLENINIEIPERWFDDPKDKNRFSGKNVIKFIRDAFSHNNINELYKIAKDGKSISICMQGTKPKPFSVTISNDDLEILIKYVEFSASTYPTFGLVLDNNQSSESINPQMPETFFDRFSFVRFFYPKKVNDGNNLYHRAGIFRTHSDVRDKILTGKAEKYNAEKREHKFTRVQTREMLRKFKGIAGHHEILTNRDSLLNYITYYAKMVLPIGVFKGAFNQNENVFIGNRYIKDWNNSTLSMYTDIKAQFDNYVKNYGHNTRENIFFDAFGNNASDAVTTTIYLNDKEARTQMNLALLASYYFRSVDNQETIKIGNEQIPVNHIRNAFAHGRWGSGEERDTIHLYDWPRGIQNELQPTWEKTIKISDLIQGINENLNKQRKLKQKNNKELEEI